MDMKQIVKEYAKLQKMPNKISSALFAAESAGISQKPPLCNCKLQNPGLADNKSQHFK